MAETVITISYPVRNGAGQPMSWTSVDGTNGMKYQNNGNAVIQFWEQGSNSPSISITGQTDPYNQTGNKTISMTAGATVEFGPYDTEAFNTLDGYCHMTFTGTVTTLKVRVVQL